MIFSHERYDQLVKATFDKIIELGEKKGGEYAGDTDRLANFRRNAEQTDVPPETVWSIYYNKHHDAVMQYIKDLKNGVQRPRMESISSRIDDMIVYLLLFKCFVEERENPALYKEWKRDLSDDEIRNQLEDAQAKLAAAGMPQQ